MIDIIIFWILLFILAMFIVVDGDIWRKKSHRSVWIAFLFSSLLVGLFAVDSYIQETRWNDGLCSCGNQWELISVQHVKNSGNHYFYQCVNCHNVIEMNYNPQ